MKNVSGNADWVPVEKLNTVESNEKVSSEELQKLVENLQQNYTQLRDGLNLLYQNRSLKEVYDLISVTSLLEKEIMELKSL